MPDPTDGVAGRDELDALLAAEAFGPALVVDVDGVITAVTPGVGDLLPGRWQLGGRWPGPLADLPLGAWEPVAITIAEGGVLVEVLATAWTSRGQPRIVLRLRERDAQRARAEQLADRATSSALALGSLTHELRTPATGLKIATELLRDRWDTLAAERREQLLGSLDRNAARLLRLVENALAAVTMWSSEVVPVPRALPLAAALEESVQDLGELAIELVDVPSDLQVFCDPSQLHQILANLLVNAAKYGQPPVRVLVRGRLGQVEIRVCDAGPGVPADFVDRLFEPFARDATATARAGGSGLGLAVARGLARANGGDLLYEDLGEDRGACFVVKLPET